MKQILPAIYGWISAWEKKATYDGLPGVVNVGCIRGGVPWRVSRTPERTDIFLDVRVPPATPLKEVRMAIKQLVLELRKKHPDYAVEYETFVSVPGAEICKEHPLVKTVEACPTPRPCGYSSGSWRDTEGEKVAIETLLNTARIYALAAAEICGAHG